MGKLGRVTTAAFALLLHTQPAQQPAQQHEQHRDRVYFSPLLDAQTKQQVLQGIGRFHSKHNLSHIVDTSTYNSRLPANIEAIERLELEDYGIQQTHRTIIVGNGYFNTRKGDTTTAHGRAANDGKTVSRFKQGALLNDSTILVSTPRYGRDSLARIVALTLDHEHLHSEIGSIHTIAKSVLSRCVDAFDEEVKTTPAVLQFIQHPDAYKHHPQPWKSCEAPYAPHSENRKALAAIEKGNKLFFEGRKGFAQVTYEYAAKIAKDPALKVEAQASSDYLTGQPR